MIPCWGKRQILWQRVDIYCALAVVVLRLDKRSAEESNSFSVPESWRLVQASGRERVKSTSKAAHEKW